MQDNSQTTRDPTLLEVLQYRYHYGVNLGSVYVLEHWLRSSAFPTNTADAQSSELEAVKGWVRQIGLQDTRLKFERRWSSSLDFDDWNWLSSTAHCTTIRLPIGYFTLGPEFCVNTPFAAYSEVYINSWLSVRAIVAQARSRHIGVLIDFHALPGGANKAEHSGTNSGVAALWNDEKNLKLAQRCLVFIANEISAGSLDGVIGLQICNEAEWNAPALYRFYDSVISAVSAIDSTIPLYISDGWDLTKALSYAKRKNRFQPGSPLVSNPICVDTHKYFCFSDDHDHRSPRQIIDSIPGHLNELDETDGSVIDTGAAQVIIGEWSCTLSRMTWTRLEAREDRGALTAEFGKAQCNKWQQRSGGAYFWTWKMDWMDGGDWGFVEQTKSGAISAPSNLIMAGTEVRAAIDRAERQRNIRAAQSFEGHSTYWDRTAPGQRFEHWQFQRGWMVGWNDALIFFRMRISSRTLPSVGSVGGDKIGCLDLWVRKRIGESQMRGPFAWEYETGLRKGIADFYDCADV